MKCKCGNEIKDGVLHCHKDGKTFCVLCYQKIKNDKKGLMDEAYFKMAMNGFMTYLENINKNCVIPTDSEVKEKYYNALKGVTPKRFAEAIKWLEENWNGVNFCRFPSIADFKYALRETYRPPVDKTPSPQKLADNVQKEASKLLRGLAETYKMPKG